MSPKNYEKVTFQETDRRRVFAGGTWTLIPGGVIANRRANCKVRGGETNRADGNPIRSGKVIFLLFLDLSSSSFGLRWRVVVVFLFLCAGCCCRMVSLDEEWPRGLLAEFGTPVDEGTVCGRWPPEYPLADAMFGVLLLDKDEFADPAALAATSRCVNEMHMSPTWRRWQGKP